MMVFDQSHVSYPHGFSGYSLLVFSYTYTLRVSPDITPDHVAGDRHHGASLVFYAWISI